MYMLVYILQLYILILIDKYTIIYKVCFEVNILNIFELFVVLIVIIKII